MLSLVDLTIVLFFVSGLILVIKRPHCVLLYIFTLYAVEQLLQYSSNLYLRHQYIYNFYVIILSLVALTKVFSVKKIDVRKRKLFYITLFLYFYSFITLFWVDNLNQSLDLWISIIPYLFLYILIVPCCFDSIDEVGGSLSGFVVFGVFLTLLLLFTVKWEYRFIVLSGSYLQDSYRAVTGNPLAIAQFAGTLCLVSILMPSNFKFCTIIRCIAFPIAVLLLIKSGSRGQLFGMLFIAFVFMPFAYRVKGYMSFLLPTLMLILMLGSTYIAYDTVWQSTGTLDAARWSNESMQGAMFGRYDAVLILLRHWFHDPFSIIFGLGNSASYEKNIIGIYPHFVPLEVLGEEGLIGFSMYLSIIYLFIKFSNKLYKNYSDDIVRRRVVVTFLAIAFYYLLMTLKQGSLLGNSIFFMFLIIIEKICLNYEKNNI